MGRTHPIPAFAAALVISTHSGAVRGQPAPEPPLPEHTAAEVVGEPLPGEESGRVDQPPGEPPMAVAARVALFVPRVAVTAVFAPVRGALYVADRYELIARYRRLFYRGGGEYGIVPVAGFETTLGPTVGAKFVHANLFDASERLTLRAMIGIDSRAYYSGRVNTGDRFGDDLTFELRGSYDKRSRSPFYGIGNGDEMEVAPPEPIDAFDDEAAVETRYGRRTAQAWLTGDLTPLPALHILPAIAIADVEMYSGSTGTSIEEVFDPMSLVGFGGYRAGYAELELRWDNRRRATIWESVAVPSRGSFASVFGGRVVIQDGPELWRYGGDLQHYLRVDEGARVIGARLHVEAITGSVTEVPFTELPTLGGETYLRGYPLERFRDRVAAVGTVEYVWDLSRMFSSSLFVDVGRVYPSLDSLSFDDLRVGYGFGLDFHTNNEFIARVILASSIDGGVFAYLSFDPAMEVSRRVERR